MQFPGAIEQARSVSWLDGVKGDMNQALVLLYLVLLILVVLINRCLGFFVWSLGCSYVCFDQEVPEL